MRLATFNILHGKSSVNGAVDLDRFAAAVRTLDADILALQEVDLDQPRSRRADLAAVAAEAMDASQHRFVATMEGVPGSWSGSTGTLPPGAAGYGIALLSRYPVLSWRTVRLPTMRGRVPILRRTRGVTLVLDEPRAAVVAELDTPDGPLTVATTHLTLIPGWNAFQLHRLVRSVRDTPRPLVLLGDLNLKGSLPAHMTGMRPLASAPTFPVGAPNRQIDHILGSGSIRATSPGVSVDLGVSDHLALMVDVTLPKTSDVTHPRGRG